MLNRLKCEEGYINKQTNAPCLFYDSFRKKKIGSGCQKPDFLFFWFACIFSCNGLAALGGPFRKGLGSKRVNGWHFISSLGCINVILFSSTIEELNLGTVFTKVLRSQLKNLLHSPSPCTSLLIYALDQCFSTAGPRPGTGPWHQLYRVARGSPAICHFSSLSNFHE